jgi:hypothetical protein
MRWVVLASWNLVVGSRIMAISFRAERWEADLDGKQVTRSDRPAIA